LGNTNALKNKTNVVEEPYLGGALLARSEINEQIRLTNTTERKKRLPELFLSRPFQPKPLVISGCVAKETSKAWGWQARRGTAEKDPSQGTWEKKVRCGLERRSLGEKKQPVKGEEGPRLTP